MKKYLSILVLMFTLVSISSCESDYEKYENNYSNKTVSYTIKDVGGRIIKGADVYMFSEANSADENLLEYANEKQKASNNGIVVFEDLFSKLIEGDNTEVNRFTFIVVYNADGEQKKYVHTELMNKDYLDFIGVIVCN
jgi:lipopolysaccharide export LptBFGC system permease protein LptF